MENSSITKAAAWVGCILAVVTMAWVLFGSSSSSSSQSPAPTATPDAGTVNGAVPFNFPIGVYGGMYLGNQKGILSADTILLGPGINEGQWKNLTSNNVYVTDGYFKADAGAASTTLYVSVGTSTCATSTTQNAIPDKFSDSATFWAQLIDNQKVATGTSGVLADDTLSHKSTYPSAIAVAPNQCLTAMISNTCGAYTQACGESATSSNRGFTNVLFNFRYERP